MGLVCGDVGLGASGGDIYGQKMRGVRILKLRGLLRRAGLWLWGFSADARLEVNRLVRLMCRTPRVQPDL
jgi:hypothetical protein